MKVLRILLLVTLFAGVAGAVGVAKASALGFEDEPCPLTDPVDHQLKVCHPDAEQGKPYSLQIKGKGGCTPDFVRYDVVAGTLPPGLTVDAGTALVHGIPTQAGKFQFWLQISDLPQSWCTDNKQSQWQFQITVNPGLQILQRQSTLTPGQTGIPYSLQFSASGGSPSWAVSSGALPAGLNLNSSTGLLSGTPTATGDFSFKVTATDGARSDTQTYGMSVVDPLKISTTAAPAGELGRPYTFTLAATGGRQGYKWTVAQGSTLPGGLNLDPDKGTITGTPTTAGTVDTSVTVTDALGLQKTVDLKIAIADRLTLVRRALPLAHVGRRYVARLFATGGVTPKVWKVIRGALPTGLRLNTATGALSGLPRTAGTTRITVQVKDALGVISRATYVVRVR